MKKIITLSAFLCFFMLTWNNHDLCVRLINLQGVSSGNFRFTDSTAFIDVSGFTPGICFLQITGSGSDAMITIKISIIK